MKIAPRAVESYLDRPDPAQRATLFYGPDSGLARERARVLTKTLLGDKPNPFALADLTEAQILSDPPLLSDELAAISLMAPRRVVLVRDAGDKLSRIVEDAAHAFNDSVFLIVCAGELTSRSALRAWFEKEAACAAIACYKDELRDLREVVRKAFATAGIEAGNDVTEYLSQQLGNDRGVTQQELEKLVTYAGESRRVSLEDARALVDYNRDTGTDDLVNAVADRNVSVLDALLALLAHEGVQPIAWLRSLQRYFNRLYFIRGRMDKGESAEQVIQGLRPPVFFRQLPLLTRHAQNWTTPQIVKALKLLVAAELACKTSDLPPLPASSRRLFQVTQIR